MYVAARGVDAFVNGAATSATRVLSFGDVVGGSLFGGNDYADPGPIEFFPYYPQLRITTELP